MIVLGRQIHAQQDWPTVDPAEHPVASKIRCK
jgi:hypothetical protein